MYKTGDKVMISISNDNDNYDDYRGKILIITELEVGGRGYDSTMYPQALIDLETIEGEEVPFSLYEYEIEPC